MDTNKLPQNDNDLKEALDKLFGEWRKAVSEDLRDNFVKDGALPGYFDQEFKILFIGREVHSGCRNIVKHVNDVISTWEGVDTCWKRAIWTAYGLLNNECWKYIPQVVKLKKEDGAEDAASFAVIEISKYANPDDSTDPSSEFEKYAYESMGVGENVSSRNFTREEIEILNPDLIISWNIRDAFKTNKNGTKGNGDCFLRELTGSNSPEKGSSKNVIIWTYTFNKRRDASTGEIKQIPLLDTWHFSTRNKSPQKDIYEPIRDVVKELIEQRKDKDKAWSELSKVWSQSRAEE